VLTTRDVNEVADTPAGAVQEAITLAVKPNEEGKKQFSDVPTGFRMAEVSRNGKVNFKDATK